MGFGRKIFLNAVLRISLWGGIIFLGAQAGRAAEEEAFYQETEVPIKTMPAKSKGQLSGGLIRLLKSSDNPEEQKRRLQSLSRLGASLRQLKEQKNAQSESLPSNP